ncbi:MAG: N-acetylmuramoyl-L-alanine amidase [Verrucomicrobiota bacterium]
MSRLSSPQLGLPLAIALALLSVLPPSQAQDFEWKIIQKDKREFVSGKNVARFYGFPKYGLAGQEVVFRSQSILIQGQLESKDLYINGVRFILNDALQLHQGKVLLSKLDLLKLINPVLRPNLIRTATPFNTVIIDPGHGGKDKGAIGYYGLEKDYNLSLSLAVGKELQRLGFKVLYTRTKDIFIDLEGRAEYANQQDNAIFLSIHHNASSRKAARGIETFALAPQGASSTNTGRLDLKKHKGNQRDSENIALATAIHSQATRRTQAEDRGIKRARFSVIRNVEIPGILFEAGFLTNQAEAKKVHTSAYRAQLAAAIAQGVLNFRAAITSR